ncbi:hypothetical protein V5799_023984 [Amblyomma americanum]|uniref:SWIM-type domain-containing protein n=1 Tax=Amblyomma americanum TaxID=6943 RepID=A0AAQ4EDQ4_AMBAM
MAHRGWSFKEEGYVKNLKVNFETADDELGLMRAACAPSMKTGVYVTTAWFVVGTGHIVGAHCDCVAGLSETCQHVAGLLFSAAARAEDAPSCTDVLCKWIVPAEESAELVLRICRLREVSPSWRNVVLDLQAAPGDCLCGREGPIREWIFPPY